MRSCIPVILILLLFLVGCGEPPEEDNPYRQEQIPWPSLADSPWPIFRHDPQGTGRSNYAGPQAGELFLEFNDSFWLVSSPVVGPNEIVYFTSSGDTSYLYAINSRGEIQWKSILSIQTGYFENWSTPTLGSNGVIYVTSSKSRDEKVHAIRTDGTELWTYPVDVNTSIALDREGNLYFITHEDPKKLISLTPEGNLRWQLYVPDNFLGTSQPTVFSPDGSTLYVSGLDSLYAVTTAGEIEWGYWTGRGNEYICIDNDGNLYFYNQGDSSITALTNNGDVRWRMHIKDIGLVRLYGAVAPTLDLAGNLYFTGYTSNGSVLIAVDIEGNLRWIIAATVSTHLVSDSDGYVYFGGGKDVFRVSPEGEIVWQTNVPSVGIHLDYCPAIGGSNTIYIGDENPRLQIIGIE